MRARLVNIFLMYNILQQAWDHVISDLQYKHVEQEGDQTRARLFFFVRVEFIVYQYFSLSKFATDNMWSQEQNAGRKKLLSWMLAIDKIPVTVFLYVALLVGQSWIFNKRNEKHFPVVHYTYMTQYKPLSAGMIASLVYSCWLPLVMHTPYQHPLGPELLLLPAKASSFRVHNSCICTHNVSTGSALSTIRTVSQVYPVSHNFMDSDESLYCFNIANIRS